MHPKTRPSLSALASAYIEATGPILARALTKAPQAIRAPIERAKEALQIELNRLARLPSHRGERRKQSAFRSELQVNERSALMRFELAARKHGTIKGAADELGLSEWSLHGCIRDCEALSDLVEKLRTEGALGPSAGPSAQESDT